MDSTQLAVAYHYGRPGFRNAGPRAAAVKDARMAARDAWIADMQNAWKRPVRDAAAPDLGTRPEELSMMRRRNAPDPDLDLSAGALQAKKDAAYFDYKNRIENAWRNPGLTDPTTANEIERLRRQVTHEI
jgi:hypothetical protein